MAFCENCGTQLNDGGAYCPKCGHSVNGAPNTQQQIVSSQQTAQTYQQPQQQPIKPDSNMTLAILSTILCCLPTGIYACILANKVDKLYYSQQYQEAEEASNGAKKWSIIGAVLGAVGWLIYNLAFIGLAVS